MALERLSFVDSHTEGEPTRVVLSEVPYSDNLRRAVVNEPRGHDVLVGALVGKSSVADYRVHFFNSVGLLGMCGHGTIGVVRTLAFLGQIGEGHVTFETPAGVVGASLLPDGSVSFANVPSYRYLESVEVEGVKGDVAWGGNWFFITHESSSPIQPSSIRELTAYAWLLRRGLADRGVTGLNGAEIDHIEICRDHRNFVLCPGGAYDRSPCGTGTSAHMACMAAEGTLQPGEIWRQESIIGGVFECSVTPSPEEGQWLPTIRGRAFIIASGELILDDDDPWCWGISP